MRGLVWAIVIAFGFTLSASAQTPRRVALVIANATYANASRLVNPPNDTRIVAEALRRVGFETVDMRGDLGNLAFRGALREFRQKANGAQVALIYYAGHGIEANGKNWLIPTDAALASDLDLPDEAIDLNRVMDDVSGAHLRVVVLDACRDNPFGRSWRASSRAVSRGLGGVDADDVLVIFAAAPGQTASDGAGAANSPFASALARRLTEPGLPVQVLGNVVRDDVLRSTGGVQRPFVSASMTGDLFYLAGGGATDPTAQTEIERLREEARVEVARRTASEAALAAQRSENELLRKGSAAPDRITQFRDVLQLERAARATGIEGKWKVERFACAWFVGVELHAVRVEAGAIKFDHYNFSIRQVEGDTILSDYQGQQLTIRASGDRLVITGGPSYISGAFRRCG